MRVLHCGPTFMRKISGTFFSFLSSKTTNNCLQMPKNWNKIKKSISEEQKKAFCCISILIFHFLDKCFFSVYIYNKKISTENKNKRSKTRLFLIVFNMTKPWNLWKLEKFPSKSVQGFKTSLSLILVGSFIIAMSPSKLNVLLNHLSWTNTFVAVSFLVFLWSAGTLERHHFTFLVEFH